MLRLSINVQDVSPFGNGQLLYIQRVKKKIENYNWFQKRPFVGGKKGGVFFKKEGDRVMVGFKS